MEATQGRRVATFFRRFLRQTKGSFAGQPVQLEDWQRFVVDEAFRVGDDGRRVYTSVTLGIPRKNGKSTLCAGLSLYLLGPDAEPGAEVYTTAGSRDQANIVFEQAVDFILADTAVPAIREQFTATKHFIRSAANRGVMRKLAADGKLNHGLNPHGVIIDELHAWVTPRQVDNYEALTTAQGARQQPIVFTITTAGDDPDSILGREYRRAMEDPRTERVGSSWAECNAGMMILRDVENRRLFIWWGAAEEADIDDPRVWRAANPASWITLEYLKLQRNSPNVTETSFRKLHLNQFVKARSAWLPWGTWEQLTSGLTVPSRIAVGVDVGISQDTTAVCWAGVVDGRNVVRSHVWSARDDVPHDTFVPGGRVKLSEVERFIVEQLASEHSIDRILFDPRSFERSAERLSDEFDLVVAPLVQSSAPMADAYHEFYVDARTDITAHNGDPVLASHVASTAAVQTERGWKVSKLSSRSRIDACVAAAMALYGARRLEDEPEPWIGWAA